MKTTLLASLVGLTLCVGCFTPQQKQWTCDTAQTAYTLYQVAKISGHLDDKLIKDAELAAAYLNAYCGWYPVPTRDAKGRFLDASSVDANGVLIISQP
jgi:hypothetical protein